MENELLVHSLTMLALSDELDEIVEKMHDHQIDFDDDESYYQSEISGVYPSYGFYVGIFSPMNHDRLSADQEYSPVDGKRLWAFYEDLAHYAKVIKCQEMIAFAEKLQAFIKEAEERKR